MFCSEMVAEVYKQLNILSNIDSETIAPVEFLGYGDNGIKNLVKNPVIILKNS